MLSPGLYVVATPIGNREDITLRALRVLAEADCIAAEDTRHSRVLLEFHGIDARPLSLHEHNEEQRIPGLLDRIRNGEAVALISDAGTPLISDPGFRLVRAVSEAGLAVHPVPGPSAVSAALSVAGLPTDRFRFEGFLPARPAARRKRLAALRDNPATLVLFETGRRIQSSLEDMQAVFGAGRRAVICRELTKQFETILRGPLEALSAQVEADADQSKGEFVILVEGSEAGEAMVDGLALAQALTEFLPASQAARVAAKLSGGSRRDIYAALGSDTSKGEKD
ncbi:MAG TPA: 16S rRNA (cytidine(1402)-2'-O)-methyltransferase [Xanthomonadales bacterium]|nr:16S rRNA (cytidine(1402)-2'-O)-methyltransferase [Xanthomonadales bacterium]